ncbi:lysine-specific demethylase 3A [Caerostris extrusa]|uniref:Lysine-specific demethylase 3A n=1 Tax=Caerostris extrusa TaxID=172846 RepID=A0AAV4TTX0_CAEEX|nr:lysine-specific demethylase 3A [Caerostris extrusa]
MTWKRIVQGVREMCDVCSTTIFNVHWVCPICGFSVCIDCYKVRKQGVVTEDDEEQPKDRDEFKWLLCTMRQPHEQDSLILTQIIPGDVLVIMNDLVHKVRDKLKIISYCRCSPQNVSSPDNIISTGLNKQLLSFVSKTFLLERNYDICTDKHVLKNTIDYKGLDCEISDCSLRWMILSDFSKDETYNSSEGNSYTFEEFNLPKNPVKWSVPETKDLVNIFTERYDDKKNEILNRFHNRYPQVESGGDPLPIQQWKRGQPILVQNVQEKLDMTLWHPDGFSRDFGDVKNDLVDCKTGSILKNLPMRKFWEGFENFSKRLTDENGEYMLLKLKDWPPGEDFSEKLPTRYQDLIKGLPLQEYTHRDGIFNLAGRLPTYFVRPDLGPKMYNAYGSALYPTKGTTNLHLDVSDAVNVMVYVGIPSDGNAELHIQEALKAIDEGGCDSLMRKRVRSKDTKPGALWHIYHAKDADKIRDLLTKVAIERGEKLEAHHDPIHDQKAGTWTLNYEQDFIVNMV